MFQIDVKWSQKIPVNVSFTFLTMWNHQIAKIWKNCFYRHVGKKTSRRRHRV